MKRTKSKSRDVSPSRLEEAVEMGLAFPIAYIRAVPVGPWVESLPEPDWAVLRDVFIGWAGRAQGCRIIRESPEVFTVSQEYEIGALRYTRRETFSLREARLFIPGALEFGRMLRERNGRR